MQRMKAMTDGARIFVVSPTGFQNLQRRHFGVRSLSHVGKFQSLNLHQNIYHEH